MKNVMAALKLEGFYVYPEADQSVVDLSSYVNRHVLSSPEKLGQPEVRQGADSGMVEIEIEWSKFPEEIAAKGKSIEETFASILKESGQPHSKVVSKIYYNLKIYMLQGASIQMVRNNNIKCLLI